MLEQLARLAGILAKHGDSEADRQGKRRGTDDDGLAERSVQTRHEGPQRFTVAEILECRSDKPVAEATGRPSTGRRACSAVRG